MAKKRKSDASGLDEVDRTLYSAFSTAANSLSQLYTHASTHHKLSFQAGQRHSLEKLYQWILKQQEEGSNVTNADIIAYLQHEIDYGTEEPSMSPRVPSQQPLAQQPPSVQVQANLFPPAASGYGARSAVSEPQARNFFNNALSSPLRSSLQHYHLAQGGSHHHQDNMEAYNGPKTTDSDNRERDSPVLNDLSMDMNADDSPSQELSYWRYSA